MRIKAISTCGKHYFFPLIRCVNEQGKLSEHYGDGLNYLYYTGQEYRNIFGVWNWQQLPGITCEQNPSLQLPCNFDFPLNASSFVGGVSDGMYGACGMVLLSHHLSTQKVSMCCRALVLLSD